MSDGHLAESAPAALDEATARGALDVALGQIEFTRTYLLEMLSATPQELWGIKPEGATSSIAWQVGHLAVSQYGLLMYRQRGRADGDLDLIPGWFRKRYGRGSDPAAVLENSENPEALLERLAKIYEQAEDELRNAPAARLVEPTEMPYAVFANKLGAILFCPLHEQLHCGQIGTLRRALGLNPIR